MKMKYSCSERITGDGDVRSASCGAVKYTLVVLDMVNPQVEVAAVLVAVLGTPFRIF